MEDETSRWVHGLWMAAEILMKQSVMTKMVLSVPMVALALMLSFADIMMEHLWLCRGRVICGCLDWLVSHHQVKQGAYIPLVGHPCCFR
jgi:hypothetical protein